MIRTVAYYSDSTSYGGMERIMLKLMEGLDRKFWQPVLIHPPEPGLSGFLQEAAQLDVRLVPAPRMPLGFSGARQLAAFKKILHAQAAGVFHAHLSWPLACKWGLVGALLESTPAVIATLHLWVDTSYSLAARWQEKMITARLGRYTTVSQEIAQKVEQVFSVPRAKLQIIHPAVDISQYEKADRLKPPDELVPYLNRPIILTVARLDKQKDLSTLLNAALKVPQAVFVIIGEGPERATLEALRQHLSLENRVVFMGFRQDIPAWLGSCRLFVLPSLYEGVPVSLLEAMAAGKPVVASKIPGIEEAVTHGESGWLFSAGDAEALANGIHNLLENQDLASRLARAGQMRVQQEFSSQSMNEKVMQVYTDLVENTQKSKRQHE